MVDDDTGLYDGDHIFHIDLEDLVHVLFHRQCNAAVGWQGTACKAAARTAWGNDNAVVVTVDQNSADILFVKRRYLF